MEKNLFEGELVRLTAIDPEQLAEAVARWSRDSEYFRLLDSSPSRPFTKKATKEWIEKNMEAEQSNQFSFMIRTLETDPVGGRLIGEIGLDGIHWSNGDTFVGIGIGEREFWGKGYGTDAMRIILRYAFTELNLQRVTLDVFEYNPRGIRSYEKCGFKHEGRLRQVLHRDGKRWDLIYMGILKEEWERMREMPSG